MGESYDDLPFDFGFYGPDETEWRAGARRVVCVALPYDDDILLGRTGGSS